MAGCAMIGQSTINVKSGGRGRLSTLIAGLFLMFLILVLGNVVIDIPMPVLVGIMVCIGTFDWHSFKYIITAPKSDALVMIVTVAIVVYTNNLAIGVIVGVILSALFFVASISKLKITGNDGRYIVMGPLFFASAQHFVQVMERAEEEHITIDFSSSRLWDESAVLAVTKVIDQLNEKQKNVELVGLDTASKELYTKLTNM